MSCLKFVSCAAVAAIALPATGAPRDVQIRSVDFTTGVVELFNFGTADEPMDGWRFCTHDDDEVLRYSGFSGFNGVTIEAGTSLFIHYNNDAPADPDRIDRAALAGVFATPLAPDAYGMGLYINSGFGSGANLADHLQWSIGGADDTLADERSDEAVSGGVWTAEEDWISTTVDSERIDLDDASGAVLHGPADYTVTEPSAACSPADIDADGDVDPDDIAQFVANFTDGVPDNADIDSDGDEDPDDIAAFVTAFIAGC